MNASADRSMPYDRLDAAIVIACLRRMQAFEIHCSRLIGGWIAGTARWESKHELARHLWQDASHSKELRTRLWELRVMNPDRGLGEEIAQLFQGLSHAQHEAEFLAGLYFVVKAELLVACEFILARSHEVLDAPTLVILRRMVPEKQAQLAWARAEFHQLTSDPESARRAQRWKEHAQRLLAHAGGVVPIDQKPEAKDFPTPPPGYGASALPFARALRDPRFTVTLAGMPLPAPGDRAGNLVFQFFNYTQEMQAVETLGSLLWETPEMEWEFHYDIARHCYDEERHSAMGELRLRELGHTLAEFPQSVGNYGWRQLLDPLHRYCVLTYVIEADSFAYKRRTYQEHLAASDVPAAEAVLWDIMDETLHVRYGQRWVPELMQRYQYTKPLDTLVAECRELVIRHSVNPLQKMAASQASGATDAAR